MFGSGVNGMSGNGIPFIDISTSQYFLSLSPLLRESIIQSGSKFQSEEDLKAFVEKSNQAK